MLAPGAARTLAPSSIQFQDQDQGQGQDLDLERPPSPPSWTVACANARPVPSHCRAFELRQMARIQRLTRNVARKHGLAEQLETLLRQEATERRDDSDDSDGSDGSDDSEDDDSGGETSPGSSRTMPCTPESGNSSYGSDVDAWGVVNNTPVPALQQRPAMLGMEGTAYKRTPARLEQEVTTTPTTLCADVSGWPFGGMDGISTTEPRTYYAIYASHTPRRTDANANAGTGTDTDTAPRLRLRRRKTARVFSLINANAYLRDTASEARWRGIDVTGARRRRYDTRAVKRAKTRIEEAQKVIRRVRASPVLVASSGFSTDPYCRPIHVYTKGVCFARSNNTAASQRGGSTHGSTLSVTRMRTVVNLVCMRDGYQPVVNITGSTLNPRCIGVDAWGYELLQSSIDCARQQLSHILSRRRLASLNSDRPLRKLVDRTETDHLPEYVAVFSSNDWMNDDPSDIASPRLFEFTAGSLRDKRDPTLKEVSFHFHVEINDEDGDEFQI